MAEKPKSIEVICTKCGSNKTRHEILYTHTESDDDHDAGVWWQRVSHFIRCAGCDTVRVKQCEYFSESTNEYGQPEPYNEKVWAAPIDGGESRLELNLIPEKIRGVHQETSLAINSHSNILAGAGLRTIVEAICQDQKCNEDTLNKKIDQLADKGLLASPQVAFLHEARILGNDTLHEISPPSDEELIACKTIVDGLLHTIYVLPVKQKLLKDIRNKKKAKKKPK